MKVCIVGHFSGNIDEGVSIVGKQITHILDKNRVEVYKIEISSLSQLLQMRKLKPDIIHFVLSPTAYGILVSKTISIVNHKAKTILSAVQPDIRQSKFLQLFKPDLTLVQSSGSQDIFNGMGYATRFLTNCVDINRFKPIEKNKISELRKKYGIPLDSYVILHLASLKKERNLDIFKTLQGKNNNLVLILGRENEPADKELINELKEAGCLVWIKHFDHVEEIYNICDCYIFPTIESKACIEMPLSVLEAMACNLPVISTRFCAMPGVFQDGNGLIYVNRVDEIQDALAAIKSSNDIDTRNKVLPYSYEEMGKSLIDIYQNLV